MTTGQGEPRRPPGRLRADFARFLAEEVWPFVSPEERGKRLTKAEQEEILGIGPDGV